jgi:hypothetical protein
LGRLLSPRHIAFWTLLASIATVVGLFVTVAIYIGKSEGAPLSGVVAPTQTSVVAMPSNSLSAAALVSPPSSPPSQQAAGLTGPETQYLADLKPVGSAGRVYDTGPQKVDASVYTHSLYALSCPACYTVNPEYDLGRSWTGFHAVIGVNDDSDPSVVLQFEVFADGKPVGEVQRLHLGQHLELRRNLSGALRLRLVLLRVSGSGQATGVWGDASLDR